MLSSREPSQFHPKEARDQFRNNNLTHISCSQFCAGYLQANIACLPSSLADDFEQLCAKNSCAFPHLYRSQPGEVTVVPLASNSDVRTDLPLYAISEDGVLTRHATDLLEIPWEDMVTFYFGCSFSFDHMLVAANVPVRHMIEKGDPPVYTTKIPLISQGPFTGNMVVSLRTIPREFVQKVAEVCVPLEFAHGAPIHIGDPKIIGIEDFRHPDFGDEPVVLEDDALIFWGCGISATKVVASAKPRIAVTLSPRCVGSLFITDLLVRECYKDCQKQQQQQQQQQQHLSPKVVFLSESPQFASLASQQAIDQITSKQNESKSHKSTESSNSVFNSSDCLLKSSMFLSHAPSVAIVSVGAFEKQLAAVICLAKALLAQEKEVTILTAESIVSEWKTFIGKCEAEEILLKCIPVTSFDAHAVIHSLGSRFYSTSLNSVAIVNKEGNITVQSLLSMTEDSRESEIINVAQSPENVCWLHPSMVAMATYILHTCPIHTRYARRGRGVHLMKPAKEFFLSSKQMETLALKVPDVDNWIVDWRR